MMNFTTDGDLYVGWAEAVVHGRIPRWSRQYNVGSIFKRAGDPAGSPRSKGSTSCSPSTARDVVLIDLLPVGAPRRDWRASMIGDGMVIVRHPELQRLIEMTDRFAADLRLYAE